LIISAITPPIFASIKAHKMGEEINDAETSNSHTNTQVQVIKNAILVLASATGSIYSIVSAADYGSEIYRQAKKAYELTVKIAYHAEKVSLPTMSEIQYAAETVDKLVNLVIQKKSLNPLISDELVAMVNAASRE